MRKKALGALTALLLGAGLATAGSANAGLVTTAVTNVAAVVNTPQICKTVVVAVAAVPEVNVTVGGITKTIDVRGIVATDVTVCVEADAAVLARLFVVLDAPSIHDGSLVIAGRIKTLAAVDADVHVTIRIGGLSGLSRVVRICDLPPIRVNADVPILIAARVI